MPCSRLLLPLVPAVLVLAACGSEATGEATGGAAATSTPPPSTAAGGPSSATPSGVAADVGFDDQTGAGDTATVARVAAPGAGFVVVLLEEEDHDDRPVAERLLGSTPVPAGPSTDVAVPLDPALTAPAELEAVLYADTDGDGAFDPTADQPVPEPDEDDDDEDDGVDDEAGYRVG